MGIAMTLEDSWGGDIVTAAIAHLAHSTPEELRFTSTDFNSYVTVSTADGTHTAQTGFHGCQRSGRTRNHAQTGHTRQAGRGCDVKWLAQTPPLVTARLSARGLLNRARLLAQPE